MKLWGLTSAYCDSQILNETMKQLELTCKLKFEHVILDHHWPIDYWGSKRHLHAIAEKYGKRVITPFKNLGGHGGYKWALYEIPADDTDLVIIVDGDAFPKDYGWDEAAVRILNSEQKIAAVYLSDERVYAAPNRTWTRREIAGVNYAVCSNYSVTDIAIARVGFLRKAMAGYGAFYGYVEEPIWKAAREMGYETGYLSDYWQAPHPIPHPEIYTRWKVEHAHRFTFPGNFDEYLKK